RLRQRPKQDYPAWSIDRHLPQRGLHQQFCPLHHKSLTRLKLIARGSHLTECTSTFPITTPAPAQRFMSNGPMTMASPSTEQATRYSAKRERLATRLSTTTKERS